VAISGAHVIVYSRDPEADRAFFRDVLDYPHVDAGDDPSSHELYLMCDDLDATITELSAHGVRCAPITEARWGRLSRFRLPGGGDVGIYAPQHPRATDL
jgi:catechol 2,3-dioxygenase-like lactoylglutathione lyase family enzyme